MTTILTPPSINPASLVKPTATATTTKQCIEVTIVEAPASPSSSTHSSEYTPSTPSGVPRHLITPSLTDEELWETWFAYPSKSGMTLHRWAEGNKSALDMFMHNLPSSPPSSLYPLCMTKCRSTLASLKVLVLGSILLIRGVNHGPQMGRTLFGRILGDRYNDLMAFTSKLSNGNGNAENKVSLVDNEEIVRGSVEEARALQARGNEFFAEGKYEASLEHHGMAIIKLIPWDVASLSPEIARRTGFEEIDQSLLLSIALTSIRITQILPHTYRSHLIIPGSRLYRLTKASCDYILHSPVSSLSGQWGLEVELASRLQKLAGEIAEIPSHERQTGIRSGGVREVRDRFGRSRF